MDDLTKQKVDAYRQVIEKDDHAPLEGAWGVTMTYANGKVIYRPFCAALWPRQMNPFNPEDYDTLEEAEAHIRTFLESATAKETARRDPSGKIMRTR